MRDQRWETIRKKEEEEEEEEEERGMWEARGGVGESVEGKDKNGVVGRHALTRTTEEFNSNSLNLLCTQPAR